MENKSFEIISTVVLVIFVTLYFTWRSSKQKKASWKGTVEKKIENYDSEEGDTTYKIVFKLDDGRKNKMTVSEALFKEFNQGDRVEKVSGEYYPKKSLN